MEIPTSVVADDGSRDGSSVLSGTPTLIPDGYQPISPVDVKPAAEGSRISITLAPDGSIAWDRMRPATQEVVRRLVGVKGADPGGARSSEAAAIDLAVVGVLYDALGSIAVTLARASGHTVDSSEFMRFSDAEKATLLPVTGKVLDKYAGALARWQDELALALLLGASLQGKIAQLRKA